MKNFWKIFFGIILIAVAGGIVLKETGIFNFDFHFWNIAICVAAAAFIVYGICTTGYFCIFGGLAVLYHGLTPILNFPSVSLWITLLAALIASIGLGMIFPKKKTVTHDDSENNDNFDAKNTQHTSTITETDGHIECNNCFGKTNDIVKCQHIKSLKAKNSFGEQTIDLTQAAIEEDSLNVEISNSFGKTLLKVPTKWSTTSNFSTNFGSAKEIGSAMQSKNDSDNKDDSDKNPKIIINGSSSFGEIIIEHV